MWAQEFLRADAAHGLPIDLIEGGICWIMDDDDDDADDDDYDDDDDDGGAKTQIRACSARYGFKYTFCI